MTAPELPITLVRRVERYLASATATKSSPFTGTQQVQDWGGRWWQYQIEFATTQGQNARTLSAFFDALGGPVTAFIFRDPSILNPTGLGTPQVNGAGQAGTTLVTDGWAGTGLRAGDFFSLGTGSNTRLYRVTANAVPVAGAATLSFVPALRTSPADNAALNVVNPGVLLRATSAIPTVIGRVDKHDFSLSAREAL
jgi:hypothetical protein